MAAVYKLFEFPKRITLVSVFIPWGCGSTMHHHHIFAPYIIRRAAENVFHI